MSEQSPNALDQALAKVCLNCPVCRTARRKQSGVAFFITKHVESALCPFCKAYERVYHLKPHQRRKD